MPNQEHSYAEKLISYIRRCAGNGSCRCANRNKWNFGRNHRHRRRSRNQYTNGNVFDWSCRRRHYGDAERDPDDSIGNPNHAGSYGNDGHNNAVADHNYHPQPEHNHYSKPEHNHYPEPRLSGYDYNPKPNRDHFGNNDRDCFWSVQHHQYLAGHEHSRNARKFDEYGRRQHSWFIDFLDGQQHHRFQFRQFTSERHDSHSCGSLYARQHASFEQRSNAPFFNHAAFQHQPGKHHVTEQFNSAKDVKDSSKNKKAAAGTTDSRLIV
jgi:hypothetical protein